MIDEIIKNYLELLSQGKGTEEAYDIVVLQGYDKNLVDLCLIEAQNFSIQLQSNILSMARSGLSPKEVVQVLQDEGYPEGIIRSHMELFLDPEA